MAVEYPLRNNPEQIKHIESVFYSNGNKPMTAVELAEKAWDPQVFNFSKNTLRDYIRRIAVRADYSILDVQQNSEGAPVWRILHGHRAFLYVLNPSKENITKERVERLKKFKVKQRKKQANNTDSQKRENDLRVLSVKVKPDEYDQIEKNWKEYNLNNGVSVSRHKFMKNVALNVGTQAQAMSAQYPNFLSEGFLKSIVNQAQAVERFHAEKTDEEKMKIFMCLFQNLVFPKNSL